jgi:hypothetical protein
MALHELLSFEEMELAYIYIFFLLNGVAYNSSQYNSLE